jgi:hypothetical protein
LESARVGCRGGVLRPEYGSEEANIGVVVFVLVVFQCAVMVVVTVFDGGLVEGGLLQGGMCPTEPSQRRNGLRDDNDKR